VSDTGAIYRFPKKRRSPVPVDYAARVPPRTPPTNDQRPARPAKAGGGTRKPAGKAPGKPAKPGSKPPRAGGAGKAPAKSGGAKKSPAKSGPRKPRTEKLSDSERRSGRTRMNGPHDDTPAPRGRRVARAKPTGEGGEGGETRGRPDTRRSARPAAESRGPRRERDAAPPQAQGEDAPWLDDDDDGDGDDIFGWSAELDDEDDAAPPPPPPKRSPPRIEGGRERAPARAAKPAPAPAKAAPAKNTPAKNAPAKPAKSVRVDGPQLSIQPNPRVPLRIVHADPLFLVVHKPAGVVTQPGEGHTRDTLLNGLFVTHGTILQNIGRHRDFGLLHRLDRATSGLVVVALTAESYDHIRKQFAERVVKKTYLALVHGAPHPPEGTERTPIWESRDLGRKRAKLTEHSTSQPAVTKYKTILRAKGLSLVECHPETGRLHQIRVHMAHRGCPVIADDDYGFAGWDAVDHTFAKMTGRAQFLHAAEISFVHPGTQKRVTFSEPLPESWVKFLADQGMTCPNKWRGAQP
jgi:23S rRNA pseudouridine1911/1915/1917 synthase